MRRLLANAVVTAGLLVPLGLYAQPHGASRPAFSGSRGSYRSFASVPRTRPIPRQARAVTSGAYYGRLSIPPVRGSSLINPGQASCILNPSYSGSPYCRQYFSGRPGFGVEPVYPYWMPSGGYDTGEEAAAPPPEAPPDTQLSDQVGNLAGQVELMREEQAQRDYRAGQPSAAAAVKPPATILIYRDGHQVEVQNYAIMGKTLWVFSGQTARQVPLADLDLAATQRVNGDRGVDFSAPGTP